MNDDNRTDYTMTQAQVDELNAKLVEREDKERRRRTRAQRLAEIKMVASNILCGMHARGFPTTIGLATAVTLAIEQAADLVEQVNAFPLAEGEEL